MIPPPRPAGTLGDGARAAAYIVCAPRSVSSTQRSQADVWSSRPGTRRWRGRRARRSRRPLAPLPGRVQSGGSRKENLRPGAGSAPRALCLEEMLGARCRRPRSSTPLRAAATRGAPSRPSFERRPRPFASACTSYTACGRHPRLSTRPPCESCSLKTVCWPEGFGPPQRRPRLSRAGDGGLNECVPF